MTFGALRHAGAVQPSRQCLLPQAPPVMVAPGEKVPFTLVQVAVFLAVARTGGPTSAAQALAISQPAVSKSMNGLEQVCYQHCICSMPAELRCEF